MLVMGQQHNGQLPISQWAITQVTLPEPVGMLPSMSKDWRARLRREIEMKGVSMKAASLGAGLGETFVRDILERDRDPSIDKLAQLAASLGMSMASLLEPEAEAAAPDIRELRRVSLDDVEGSPADFDENGDGVAAAARFVRKRLGPGEVIERDARGGLGVGGHASVTTVDGHTVDAVRATWTFPVSFLHSELRAKETDVDIIPVDGDSMIPTLLPGDRVMIQRSATRPSPDGLFAIDDGIGVSVKRLQIVRGSEPLMVRIISDNPQHATDTVLAESLKVIGRVICKVTRL